MLSLHNLTESDLDLIIRTKTQILPSEICVFQFETYLSYAMKHNAALAAAFSKGTPATEVYTYILSTEIENFLRITWSLNDKVSVTIIPAYDNVGLEFSDRNILLDLYNVEKFDGSMNYLGKPIPMPLKKIVSDSIAGVFTHPNISEAIKHYNFVDLITKIDEQVGFHH